MAIFVVAMKRYAEKTSLEQLVEEEQLVDVFLIQRGYFVATTRQLLVAGRM